MKTVTEMACEAGFACEPDGHIYNADTVDSAPLDNALERFAALVRADERARMAEQQAQQEPTVSKGAYNRLRDDYNDLVNRSEQDAKDAKEWRAHVNRCKLAGVDLDYKITAPQPAQQHVSVTDELVDDYCKAWEQSFSADNPYHTVSMTAGDRKHIEAGLNAALVTQPAPVQQEPVDLVDGEGNPLTLMQAIDHAVKAAETNGAHRLNKILVAAKKALAEQPAPVQQEPTRRTHEDRN